MAGPKNRIKRTKVESWKGSNGRWGTGLNSQASVLLGKKWQVTRPGPIGECVGIRSLVVYAVPELIMHQKEEIRLNMRVSVSLRLP